MSEKEYKTKCENMFAQNTVLINENEQLKKDNKDLQTRCHIVPEHYLSEAIDKCNEYEKQIENYKLSENESKEIIAELKAKIEKMKSHENCKYRNIGVMAFPIGEHPCSNCLNFDKWEYAE